MTNEDCNHTLYVTDDRGRLRGTWIEKKKGRQVRIVCAICGRFYGYRETRQQRRARHKPSSGGETQT